MAFTTTTFLTKALRRPVTINVAFPTDKMVLPDGYLPEMAPMKTLYTLEGLTGCYGGVTWYTRMQAIAEDYNLCVISVDGANKFYGDSPLTGDYYGTLITDDLVRFTRATFNLSKKREDTFLGGFSAGGVGTLTCGLRHPELFSHLIVMSPGLYKDWVLDPSIYPLYKKEQYEVIFGLKQVEDLVGSPYDYEHLAKRVAEEKKELMPKIFMSCGDKDSLYEPSKQYYGLLRSLGYDVTYITLPGLAHSWSALEKGMLQAAQWLPVDSFRGNIIESTEEQNFGGPESLFWQPYYMLKADL